MLSTPSQNSTSFLWAHSLDDYMQMFDLTKEELQLFIIDCASGISSFNAEMHAQKRMVVSCDEMYRLSPDAMEIQVEGVLSEMPNAVHVDRYQERVRQFFDDYASGYEQKRYRFELLPHLSFPDAKFELALCAYFLFSVPELSVDFHLQSILEMCRVAEEVRIFPLMDQEGVLSAYLEPVMVELRNQDFGVEVRQAYDTIKNAENALLRVWLKECPVRGGR